MGIEEIVYIVSTLLVIVGAINWGAYALGHNLVEKLGNKNIKNSIYYLIAISGVVSLVFFIRYKGWKESITSQKPTTRKTSMSVGAWRTVGNVLCSDDNIHNPNGIDYSKCRASEQLALDEAEQMYH